MSTSTTPPPTVSSHIRIARPTTSLPALRPFYITGLGFTPLYEFTAHAGFSGMMLGHPGAGYHLEFTVKDSVEDQTPTEIRAPSDENLFVFYLPDEEKWREAVRRMESAGFEAKKPGNPYWEDRGRTFEDPDGYRVVLQNAGWENEGVRGRWLDSLK